ncbi:PKD domain-containing protein [Promicromonospora sp. NPDC050880]|uniref:PKD domain-containing protein n=1 Tax=Promicromonospora sp. NPDC050880 TaxID=3364406 RepID=UPI003789C82E
MFGLALAVGQFDEQPTFSGTSQYDQISVEAVTPLYGHAREGINGDVRGTPPSVTSPLRQWRTTPALCFLRDLSGATVLAESCDEGHQLAYAGIECEDDEQAVGALFEQRRESGGWTEAELVEEEACLTEARQQIDIPAAAARAFQEMQIEPSSLTVQPPDGWTLVNVDTIAYTDGESRTTSTELFGIPVDIRAVPSSYTWNFGDGSPAFSTADPGAPYPTHTISHAYSKQGSATISLTTTWRGQFRIAGDSTWRDVAGEATTASSSGSLDIVEARARLVEDLYGR